MPWMPSLARVMPATSVFMSSLPVSALFGRRAVLGVTVAVFLKDLLHDLGLEFAVRTLRHLGQVKVLDRIAIGVEFESATERREVGLLQRGRDRVLVGKVALHRLDRTVDQQRRVIGLHRIGAGDGVVGSFIARDELFALGIVEV